MFILKILNQELLRKSELIAITQIVATEPKIKNISVFESYCININRQTYFWFVPTRRIFKYPSSMWLDGQRACLPRGGSSVVRRSTRHSCDLGKSLPPNTSHGLVLISLLNIRTTPMRLIWPCFNNANDWIAPGASSASDSETLTEVTNQKFTVFGGDVFLNERTW